MVYARSVYHKPFAADVNRRDSCCLLITTSYVLHELLVTEFHVQDYAYHDAAAKRIPFMFSAQGLMRVRRSCPEQAHFVLRRQSSGSGPFERVSLSSTGTCVLTCSCGVQVSCTQRRCMSKS